MSMDLCDCENARAVLAKLRGIHIDAIKVNDQMVILPEASGLERCGDVD